MPVRTKSEAVTLTATECAVLGLLTKGERSGYDLAKKAERSVGYVWAPARSQIYAVLPRLVRQGLATSRKIRQSARPDKQVYRITTSGSAALRDWLETSPDSEATFLLRVFFGDLMSREALVSLIERRRNEARSELTEFRAIEERIKDEPTDFHPYLTLRWGFAHHRALIRWTDEILRELDRGDEA
jgi:PadR family transcriptional regulator, regulatory protein AphA